MRTLASLLILLSVSGCGDLPVGPAHEANCAKLQDAITAQEKHVSLLVEQAQRDDSAIRGQMFASEAADELLLVQTNLELLKSNRCPAHREPILATRYQATASVCVSESRATPYATPPVCDRSKWKTDAELNSSTPR